MDVFNLRDYENLSPFEIKDELIRLAHASAQTSARMFLNGGGFHAPDRSARVSFANLDDDVYDDIDRVVRAIAHDYVQAYRSAQQTGGAPPVPADVWPKETIP